MRHIERFRLIQTASVVLGACLAVAPLHATTIKGVVEDADGTKVAERHRLADPGGRRRGDGQDAGRDQAGLDQRRALGGQPGGQPRSLPEGNIGRQRGIRRGGGLPTARYFLYVEPADARYLPGGDQVAQGPDHQRLAAETVTIKVSGNTPPDASYVGTTKCLKCHEDQEHFPKTLHRLGIRVIGSDSKLQDYSRFPDFNQGLDKLMAGTKFWFHGFDKERGFDKYQISDKVPADPSTVSFTATFYKDADGTLKFRTENARDPSDPPRVYPVELTYGGGLYKQRYLYRVGQNLFPFVQFNTQGDSAYKDRRPQALARLPRRLAVQRGDQEAHRPAGQEVIRAGVRRLSLRGLYPDPDRRGPLHRRVGQRPPNGELDIDGDGTPNEINMGCETCHGPGSVHAESEESLSIVNPGKLASERASTICVQCHSRPQGHLGNDSPVDITNRMMPPGTSRNTFLNQFTSREDAAAKDFWPDGVHSKAHHQQGTDFVRSSKYRNDRHLVACYDCHDPHGTAEFPTNARRGWNRPRPATSATRRSWTCSST
jgi:hypothetical protein